MGSRPCPCALCLGLGACETVGDFTNSPSESPSPGGTGVPLVPFNGRMQVKHFVDSTPQRGAHSTGRRSLSTSGASGTVWGPQLQMWPSQIAEPCERTAERPGEQVLGVTGGGTPGGTYLAVLIRTSPGCEEWEGYIEEAGTHPWGWALFHTLP